MKKITVTRFCGFGAMFLSLSANAQERKNVLFIAVDDLKPLLGCYGDEVAQTPNIDRLAGRGFLFQSTYCQQAVSAPSRASLLSGMRPDYTQVWDLKTQVRDRVPDILMLPQYFRQNGYLTTGVGKIYDRRSVDRFHDKISWSEPFEFEGDSQYVHQAYGTPALGYYQLKETKQLAEKYINEASLKGLKGNSATEYAIGLIKPSTECADVPDNAYVDGVLTLSAISRLKELKAKKSPFFLAVGFKRPHLPFVAPKKYWDMYDRNNLPLASYQKAATGGPLLAYHNSGELRSYTDIPPLESFSDIETNLLPEDKQRELIHGYYACVSYIDEMVGHLLQALDSLGLSDNTIVILWGDHGWHLGDHGLWCKHTNFEQATHSPLIISAPGTKPGKNNSITEFVDIFPTVCELAGIAIPPDLDGSSLVPVMKGETDKVKEYGVSQFPRGKTMGYAFRTQQYRYVVWLKNDYRSDKPFSENLVEAEELYDYCSDPLETRNLATDKNNKALALMRNYSKEYFTLSRSKFISGI